MAATLKARIEAHIVVLRKRAAEMIAEADALHAAVNEQPTNGQMAKQLLDFFCEKWKEKYRADYVVAGAKDMASLKRLLASLPPREIATRMKAYLKSGERFYVDAHHGLSVFVGAINKFGSTAEFALVTPPVGCKHKPACADDVVHTQRMMREARS